MIPILTGHHPTCLPDTYLHITAVSCGGIGIINITDTTARENPLVKRYSKNDESDSQEWWPLDVVQTGNSCHSVESASYSLIVTELN